MFLSNQFIGDDAPINSQIKFKMSPFLSYFYTYKSVWSVLTSCCIDFVPQHNGVWSTAVNTLCKVKLKLMFSAALTREHFQTQIRCQCAVYILIDWTIWQKILFMNVFDFPNYLCKYK